MENSVEKFGEDSNIVFAMKNSQGVQAEVYCPQPSFSRTKPILPLLRVLGDKSQEVSPLSYSVDFEFFLEEALQITKSRGYEGMEKKYEAWIKEFFSMAKCFNTDDGEEMPIKDFILNDEDKMSFNAWLTFFFILSRYILNRGALKKGNLDYFTHLSFGAFKDAFMSYLAELESEEEQPHEQE